MTTPLQMTLEELRAENARLTAVRDRQRQGINENYSVNRYKAFDETLTALAAIRARIAELEAVHSPKPQQSSPPRRPRITALASMILSMKLLTDPLRRPRKGRVLRGETMPTKRNFPKRYVELRQTLAGEWDVSLNAPHWHETVARYPADQHRQALDYAGALASERNSILVWDGTGELTRRQA